MPRRGPKGIFTDAVTFLHWRDRKTEAENHRSTARDTLQKYILPDPKDESVIPNNVRVDEDGHRHLEFDVPVEVNGVKYAGLVNQRKVSSGIDMDKVRAFFQPAEEAREEMEDVEIARRRLLLDRLYRPVTEYVWDLEQLYVLQQQGLLSEDELDSLISVDITWALNVEKSK